jgi:uncharacterized membrane protein
MSAETLVTLAGMMLVTYGARLGGLWLMSRLRPSARLERWLRSIPGAVLVAIVAPSIVAGGTADALGALATMAVAARSKNVLLAMIAGVGVVFLVRGALAMA